MVAAGAGDDDFPPAPGHPELLAALGAAVIAVGPVLEPPGQLHPAVFHPVPVPEEHPVLPGPGGNIPGQHPEIGPPQQQEARHRKGPQPPPGEHHQHHGKEQGGKGQLVGAIPAHHEPAQPVHHTKRLPSAQPF